MEIKNIAVVGSGVIGSYLYSKLNDLNHFSIDLIDLADKPETPDPFDFIESGNYQGLSKGRSFGLYGTSRRWGGQINFIDDNDLKASPKLRKITKTCYPKVLKTLFSNSIKLEHSYRTKKGLWLWPWRRNIAKKLLSGKKADYVCVVESIHFKNKSYYLETSLGILGPYSGIYLAAGAFESCKILARSSFIPNILPFRDHISFKTHSLKLSRNCSFINNLLPRLTLNGMLTSRYTIPGGFIHISFNERVYLFSILKKLIFNINTEELKRNILIDLAFLVRSIPQILSGKFPIDKEISLHVDLDSEVTNQNEVLFDFKSNTTSIKWEISERDKECIMHHQSEITKILFRCGIDFKEETMLPQGIRNTFHPTGMLNNFLDKEDFVSLKEHKNIKIFSTANLEGGFSSNPTATVLTLVENIINGIQR